MLYCDYCGELMYETELENETDEGYFCSQECEENFYLENVEN